MPRLPATTGCLTLAALMALMALMALGGCSTLQQDLHTPWQAWKTSLTIPLSGAAQVPPVTTQGAGTVLAHLDPSSRLLSWTVTYAGLSGPVTGAHFHGPALPGENAAVVVPLAGSLTSPIQGTAILTPEQAVDFLAGRWYINLHTAANPGGEIRAQIPAKP